MSTDLRELFDASARSEIPFDAAEKAIGAARTRRRQRFVVGGAVVATAATTATPTSTLPWRPSPGTSGFSSRCTARGRIREPTPMVRLAIVSSRV